MGRCGNVATVLPRALQEYVDYNGGAGVQHIALKTQDIITAVSNPCVCPMCVRVHICTRVHICPVAEEKGGKKLE